MLHESINKDVLNVYILLDTSGSMASKWDDAIGAINSYVATLKNQNTDSIISVYGFNSAEIIREPVNIKYWLDIDPTIVKPLDMTPLYDYAASVVNIALKNDSKKSVILFVTDGFENSSREHTLESAKALIEKCKEKSWEVIFLGAEFNVATQAKEFGFNLNKTISISNKKNLKHAANYYAAATTAWASRGIEISTATYINPET